MLNSIHLQVEWIHRYEIEMAYYLSKTVETDDWGISFHILDIIMQRWGSIDVDWFESEHNAKSTIFYLKF